MAQAQIGFKDIQSTDPTRERLLITRRLGDIEAKITDFDTKLSSLEAVH